MLTFEDAPAISAQPERPLAVNAYHNGRAKDRKALPISEREVIAWDTEGMSLSGQDKPQHAVIFGSSAADPIINEDIPLPTMWEHIFTIARANPNALHVGFGWRYDANMLVKGLPPTLLRTLNKHNRVTFKLGEWQYTIHLYPGKWFQISRCEPRYMAKVPIPGTKGKRIRSQSRYQVGENQTVKIYDFASFFQRPFIDVCEELLRDELTEEDRLVIVQGKEKRGSNNWSDIAEVLYYWSIEIQLIKRTFERFREVMIQAGFSLKDWYGPGALANYIIATRGLRKHLAGAQSTSGILPIDVHEASKRAFAGGRFEMFQAGRIQGPIHVYDINSAYPFALTMVPSLAESEGFWQYRDARTIKTIGVERFGVYHIRHNVSNATIEYRAMPYFHRDQRGLISFPGAVDGWYMSPEARIAVGHSAIEIVEGWVWVSKIHKGGQPVLPWDFLYEMYETRQRLGKKNLLSLPFKLGPNSLYGKLAQTVGWDKKAKLPPKSHALLIAAWVTSFCRTMLWSAIMKAPEKVIAVETDSVVTLASPEEMGLDIGSELGQWGHEEYDEIIYIQNGLYHARRGSEWVINKSRGLDRTDVPIERVEEWLASLADEDKPLIVQTKPRFMGLAFAAHMATEERPLEARHCVWEAQTREIKLGETGKRRHSRKYCPKCQAGISLNEGGHPMSIGISRQLFGALQPSQPRRLPWEGKHPTIVQEIRAQERAEQELLHG